MSTSPPPGTWGPDTACPSLPKQRLEGGKGGHRSWDTADAFRHPAKGCVCVLGEGVAGRVAAFIASSRQCLLPVHTRAAGTQGHSPQLAGLLPCCANRQALRLGYQLEFHPVNGTHGLSKRVAEHLLSSLAPHPPMATPMQRVNLGDVPPGSVPLQASILSKILQAMDDARGWGCHHPISYQGRTPPAGPHVAMTKSDVKGRQRLARKEDACGGASPWHADRAASTQKWTPVSPV